jgi:hypothetical protein
MSKRLLVVLVPLVLLAVVVLFGVGALLWFARPKPAAVTIDITGPAGMPIKGTAEIDGRPRELSGEAPTKFDFEGCRITFSLTTTADRGEFRVKGSIDGKVYGSAGSLNPPTNGVRGWVVTGWGWSEPRSWIEGFAMDGKPDWRSPPPP